jgi:hypothetical protein
MIAGGIDDIYWAMHSAELYIEGEFVDGLEGSGGQSELMICFYGFFFK